MKEKITHRLITDIEDFIKDSDMWPDFIKYMQDNGYSITEGEALDEQLEIKD